MRILTDREIFGDPYEEAFPPPPYEDWETQGRHIKNYPAPEVLNKLDRQAIAERRLWKSVKL